MLDARGWLFVALGAFTVFLVWAWFRGKGRAPGVPSLFELFLGMATNFFDTLGIGSFAPTASVFKFRHMVPDEKIPGTLNVGHALPTLLEAFLFIVIVKVDILTLVLLMGHRLPELGLAQACGALAAPLGAGRHGNRAAGGGVLFPDVQPEFVPGRRHRAHPSALALWAGVIGSLMLGAFMTLGIGLYAPCMILVSLLGMDPKAAFPIMMGSCAFLMPVASARFIQAGSYSPRVALGLALGGLPGVLIAALIVKSLPLTAVRWLVVVAVIYAAITMLRSARIPL